MRSILYAAAAVFIFLGVASLLAVFLMPWLLAYGFSVPAALILILGGVMLVALAAQIDAVQKVESAVYGLQKSLRHAASATSASPNRPVDKPLAAAERPQEAVSAAASEKAETATARAAGKTRVEKPQPVSSSSGAGRQPERKKEPPAQAAAATAGTMMKEQRKEVPPPRPQEPAAVPPVREEGEAVAVPPKAGDKDGDTAAPSPVSEKEPAAPESATMTEDALIAEENEGGAEKPSAEGGFLYIVREETVRGRRARVLSDGTIEAELDDGWLRFENMDHLNEYLDALEELRKKGMI